MTDRFASQNPKRGQKGALEWVDPWFTRWRLLAQNFVYRTISPVQYWSTYVYIARRGTYWGTERHQTVQYHLLKARRTLPRHYLKRIEQDGWRWYVQALHVQITPDCQALRTRMDQELDFYHWRERKIRRLVIVEENFMTAGHRCGNTPVVMLRRKKTETLRKGFN